MSGALDEDTRQSLDEGRATLGAMLSSAQDDLQRVFIIAVLGLVGTIYVLREFVWDKLKADLIDRELVEIVVVTPFDVILLQVKFGLIVGAVLAVPAIVWYSRDALRERGYWPSEQIPRWQLGVIATLATSLFLLGISYAYFLFFPLMFDFLATNAVNVGFEPTYSIVDWAEFILLLSISFAIAAQLPLVMSALSYAEIVRYETFRDKWRYAVLGIFGFGALFSPPDPFTQIMWALPLILLYAFSVKTAQVATIARRSGERVNVGSVARRRWNVLAGSGFLAFVGVYGFLTRGGIQALNDAIASLPPWVPAWARPRPRQELAEVTSLPEEVAAGLVGLGVALVVVAGVLLVVLSRAFSAADVSRDVPHTRAESADDVDFEALSADQVESVPLAAFADLSEREATAKASAAMEADDPEKAQAILDRFDAAEEEIDEEEEDDEAGDAAAADDASEEGAGTVTETTAGMVNAFTEDETTEDDIGGYYYDITFILESLTSKAFRLVGVFMAVLAGSFLWLYQGGIRQIKNVFFARMPEALQPDVSIVTLHPVEALIFQIKFSTLLGIVATLPLVLYYAWPALKDRGWVRGDRRVLLVWGSSMIVGIIASSLLGFLYIAPTAISWLATDAIQSNMVIAYRISNFGWLVVYLTVGVGLLGLVPVTMVLFHIGNIATYRTFHAYWRHVVVGFFVAGSLLSPRGTFTMLLIALPAVFVFLLGLVVLWLMTFGGRRGPPEPQQAGAD